MTDILYVWIMYLLEKNVFVGS